MAAEPASALLRAARRALEAIGTPTPALDARLLLQHATGWTHRSLIADPDRNVEPRAADLFRNHLSRRLAREPVSRIIGEREFYGRSFRVTPAVLDPRADTETLIEAALPLMTPGCRLLDLGAGSGIIAITLLAERPDATATAVDVSADALEVTRANAEHHGVAARLSLAEGSWFAPISGTFDLIVSNPPYVPEAGIAALDDDVRRYDPHAALSGGADGLAAYRSIATGARNHLAPGAAVIVEIGAGQHQDVVRIFHGRGLELQATHADLAGHIRCLRFLP